MRNLADSTHIHLLQTTQHLIIHSAEMLRFCLLDNQAILENSDVIPSLNRVIDIHYCSLSFSPFHSISLFLSLFTPLSFSRSLSPPVSLSFFHPLSLSHTAAFSPWLWIHKHSNPRLISPVPFAIDMAWALLMNCIVILFHLSTLELWNNVVKTTLFVDLDLLVCVFEYVNKWVCAWVSKRTNEWMRE